MAISNTQPLLLLVSLFFLPAALGTKFQTCNTSHHYPIDVKTVEISPYPVNPSTNGNITITGSTSTDIPDGATIVLGLTIPMIPVSKKTYSFCDIVACPVTSGPIVFTLSNVFTQKELKFKGYQVTVSIIAKQQKDPMMCVSFLCRITSQASLLRQATD